MQEDLFEHSVAAEAADRLQEYLELYAGRICVCGSIRRMKSRVHDIDIVMQPKPRQRPTGQLFGKEETVYELPELPEWAPVHSRGPDIVKGRVPIPGGGFIPFDLYRAPVGRYALLCLIRTGSKEHNIKLAKRAKELGGKLHADGSGITLPGKGLIPVTTEEHAFELLGLTYLKPEARD